MHTERVSINLSRFFGPPILTLQLKVPRWNDLDDSSFFAAAHGGTITSVLPRLEALSLPGQLVPVGFAAAAVRTGLSNNLFQHLPSLRHLTLSLVNPDRIGWRALSLLPNLENLTLMDVGYLIEPDQMPVFSQQSNLVSLMFVNVRINPNDAWPVVPSLGWFPTALFAPLRALRRLSVDIGAVSVQNFSFLKLLRYLDMNGSMDSSIISPVSDALMKMLPSLYALRFVSHYNNPHVALSDAGFSFFERLVRLEIPFFEGNLTSDALEPLQSSLRYLDVSHCSFVSDEWLRHLPGVTHLKINGCNGENLTDQGFSFLRAIRVLEMRDCGRLQITDGMLRSLGAANIQRLDITACVQLNGDALRFLEGIVHLSLESCDQVTDNHLAQLPLDNLEVLDMRLVSEVTDASLFHLSTRARRLRLLFAGCGVESYGDGEDPYYLSHNLGDPSAVHPPHPVHPRGQFSLVAWAAVANTVGRVFEHYVDNRRPPEPDDGPLPYPECPSGVRVFSAADAALDGAARVLRDRFLWDMDGVRAFFSFPDVYAHENAFFHPSDYM